MRAFVRFRFELEGVVQGVGFRPFVARLANDLGLSGWVANRANGVVIEVEGDPTALETFSARIVADKPLPSRIDRVHHEAVPLRDEAGFRIVQSLVADSIVPTLLPDTVTCPACIAEMRDPANRRYGYPFISCAECGPRHSIVEALPFDRDRTTLADFPLCPDCLAEYENPADRRFHAQTITCPRCGPRLTLLGMDGQAKADGDAALDAAIAVLRTGGVVGLKGIGGFQLLVDARNESAVQRLRERKARPKKPFAVMVAGLGALGSESIKPEELTLLASPSGPIVLLDCAPGFVAPPVAPDSPRCGVMLPTSGLHSRLLDAFGGPLVATSGNRSGQPIAINDAEALLDLAGIADCLLTHDRRIAARLDDSLAQIVAGAPQLLRRARGFVPLTLPFEGEGGVLALGAHQKNTVAIGLGPVAVIGAHNGDLDDASTRLQHEQAAGDLLRLCGSDARHIIVDAHPDYASSRFGETLALAAGLPLSRVLHHHAHVHAVIAEHRLAAPLLGVAWDGLGLGEDGALWGGEFFLVEARAITRIGGIRPFPLPGGERASQEPRRAALGCLYALEGVAAFGRAQVAAAFAAHEMTVLQRMLERGLNSPQTSSVGRLFDAVASLLGLRQSNAFEGDAAMQLQFLAERGGTPDRAYPVILDDSEIDWRPAIAALLDDLAHNVDIGRIAARFHETLARTLAAFASRAKVQRVALAGGCFQNRLLLARCIALLGEQGLDAYWPQQVPSNDGGIALGQLSAHRWGHVLRAS
ncbi:carbamoyltransferase HypF [Uliginosibacterium sp. sgz301328]|uniref:carbamoyltransferase HypF n=1 Tax=Uliginosibacterium sp. sgz301328 TaxID=3243764 RepID=UPI00359CEE01